MGMVRPQGALADFQDLLMEKLCLGIIATFVKQVGKIVHGCEAVDVLGAEHPLPFRQALAKEVFGGRVTPFS